MTEHPEADARQADDLSAALRTVARRVDNIDAMLADAAAHHVREGEVTALVERIAALADVRKRLHQAEAYLTRELGHMVRDGKAPKEDELADGRRWEAHAPKRRIEWKHDDLRRDVRRAVVHKYTSSALVIDGETGEEVDLYAMLAEAQSVHGATAPKVTALDALGLDRDAYSSSYWGPWTIDVTARPDTTTTTTPDE